MKIICTQLQKDFLISSMIESDFCFGCVCDYNQIEKQQYLKGFDFSQKEYCKICLDKNINWIVEEAQKR